MGQETDLSVGAFLGKIWDFFAELLSPLANLPWDFGDWTLFMPILFWIGYWAYCRIRHFPRSFQITSYVILAGFIFGGVFEHYQTELETCLPDGPRTCIDD